MSSYDSEEESESVAMPMPPPKHQRPAMAQQQQRRPQEAPVPKLTLNKLQVGIIDTYKSRSARPAFYNQQVLATESADMQVKQGHILLHKNLQLKFLGEENEELRNKVQNLEKTVKVNKEIMTTMLQQDA